MPLSIGLWLTLCASMLLTHLYEFFGALLGCTMMGSDAFPAYSGFPSMASVHKYANPFP